MSAFFPAENDAEPSPIRKIRGERVAHGPLLDYAFTAVGAHNGWQALRRRAHGMRRRRFHPAADASIA
jgi:hypothetical protein